MAVLPEVVKAVDGRAKVIVDGGFLRGTDIVKAIALGAELVGIGRLHCYALAAGRGGRRRAHAASCWRTRCTSCSACSASPPSAELDGSYLHPVAPVVQPHVHSAFPLTNLTTPATASRLRHRRQLSTLSG